MGKEHIIVTIISSALGLIAALIKYRKIFTKLSSKKQEFYPNQFIEKKKHYFHYDEINRNVKFNADVRLIFGSSFKDELLEIMKICREKDYNNVIFDLSQTKEINEYTHKSIIVITDNILRDDKIKLTIICSPELPMLYKDLNQIISEKNVTHVKLNMANI